MVAARIMSDSTFSPSRASYDTVLDFASRSLAMARALAEGYRSGLRPPEDVLDAYLARIERDEAELKALRQRVAELNVS